MRRGKLKKLQFCDFGQANSSKGQLISECLFGGLNFPKKPTKKSDKFLPQNLKSGQINKIKGLSYDTIIHI